MLIKDPPVEIADHLFMLGTTEYPLFVYRGAQQATIFEGGVSCVGLFMLQQMAALGIGKESVKQVVVTHAHPDHVMAVPMFRQVFAGITVTASDVAAKTLGVEKAMSFFAKVDGALTSSLMKAGRVARDCQPATLTEMQIAVDRVVAQGDTIEVDDGVAFEVLETPGHSDCSLSFHEPSSGILIISDATGYFLPDPAYWWPNYFSDYSGYVGSMERLAALDAQVLCLSHNAVIKGADDVEAYFAGAIAATKDYHQRIVDETKAGKTTREIAERLGSEVYERTQLLPLDFFQKNCGLLVKLSLQHEGLAGE